jgi:hypothetical protein
VRLLNVFQRYGLRPTLLKGMHTGRSYLPRAYTRPAADIDLLVRPEALRAAARALRDAGFTEHRRTTRPFRSEWTPAATRQRVHSLELEHADNPWGVDLHVSLERWYFRGVRADLTKAAWDSTSSVLVQKLEVPVLGQPILTAFLAMHASHPIYALQLIRLVELALVIRRDCTTATLQWDDLVGLLEASGTARFVYPALELTERLVPGTLSPAVRQYLHQCAPSRAHRLVDEISRTGSYRLRHRSLEERLMWSQGFMESVLNVLELAWPADGRFSTKGRLTVFRQYLPALLGRRIRLRSRTRR